MTSALVLFAAGFILGWAGLATKSESKAAPKTPADTAGSNVTLHVHISPSHAPPAVAPALALPPPARYIPCRQIDSGTTPRAPLALPSGRRLIDVSV